MMRIESLYLLPSQPNHNKRWATFSVGSPFELAIVVDLLAMRGYEVIDVQTGQIHNGRLLSNMPWAEMFEFKDAAMAISLPTYTGEEEAAEKKATSLIEEKKSNQKGRLTFLNSRVKILNRPLDFYLLTPRSEDGVPKPYRQT